VFVSAVGRADELALAIEARGYDSHAERSIYSEAKCGMKEWVFAAVSIGCMILLFMVTQHNG
jgi:energy-coupling factor transporter transmembrane protein EcfT